MQLRGCYQGHREAPRKLDHPRRLCRVTDKAQECRCVDGVQTSGLGDAAANDQNCCSHSCLLPRVGVTGRHCHGWLFSLTLIYSFSMMSDIMYFTVYSSLRGSMSAHACAVIVSYLGLLCIRYLKFLIDWFWHCLYAYLYICKHACGDQRQPQCHSSGAFALVVVACFEL